MAESETWVRNPFEERWGDAITFARLEAPEQGLEASFGRTSILNAALAVEALANRSLKHLHSDSEMYGELERLSTINKLNLVLVNRSKPKLNAGCEVVRKTKAILKLRDQIVHPKDERHDRDKASIWVTSTVGAFPMPKLLKMWNQGPAVEVIRVSDQFCSNYIISLDLDFGEHCKLLCHEEFTLPRVDHDLSEEYCTHSGIPYLGEKNLAFCRKIGLELNWHPLKEKMFSD